MVLNTNNVPVPGRGQKLCGGCGAIVGARSLDCKSCGAHLRDAMTYAPRAAAGAPKPPTRVFDAPRAGTKLHEACGRYVGVRSPHCPVCAKEEYIVVNVAALPPRPSKLSLPAKLAMPSMEVTNLPVEDVMGTVTLGETIPAIDFLQELAATVAPIEVPRGELSLADVKWYGWGSFNDLRPRGAYKTIEEARKALDNFEFKDSAMVALYGCRSREIARNLDPKTIGTNEAVLVSVDF